MASKSRAGECPFCHKMFANVIQHGKGCKQNPDKVPYKCALCGETFMGKPAHSKHWFRCKTKPRSDRAVESSPKLIVQSHQEFHPPIPDWRAQLQKLCADNVKIGDKLEGELCTEYLHFPFTVQFKFEGFFPTECFNLLEMETMLRSVLHLVRDKPKADLMKNYSNPVTLFESLLSPSGVPRKGAGDRIISWLSGSFERNVRRAQSQAQGNKISKSRKPKTVCTPGGQIRVQGGTVFHDAIVFSPVEAEKIISGWSCSRAEEVENILSQQSEQLGSGSKLIFPVRARLPDTTAGDRDSAWVLFYVKFQTKNSAFLICCEVLDFGGVSSQQIDQLSNNLKTSLNKLYPKRKKGWSIYKQTFNPPNDIDDFFDGPRVMFTVALLVAVGTKDLDKVLQKAVCHPYSERLLGRFCLAIMNASLDYEQRHKSVMWDKLVNNEFYPDNLIGRPINDYFDNL